MTLFGAKYSSSLTSHQRGAGTVESLMVLMVLGTMLLGTFQGLLAYRAKISLNHAVTEAARTGAVTHAQSAPMIESISEQMSPLYGGWGTGGTEGLIEAIAESTLDIATPIASDGAGLQLHILNPTDEAFTAFGENNANGIFEIPNHHLKHRDRAVDSAAGVNIQDANLLKIHVTYGYKLNVPIVDKIIATAGNTFDPQHSAYYSATPPRLPITSTAVARMHTAARKDDANLSVGDDLGAVTAAVVPPGDVESENGDIDHIGNSELESTDQTTDQSDLIDPTNLPDQTDPTEPTEPDNLTDTDSSNAAGTDEPEEPLECEARDEINEEEVTDDDRSFWDRLYDGVVNTLGVARDFARGVWAGLRTQLEDIWALVTSPIETGKGLIALGQALISDAPGTLQAIGDAIGRDLSALVECGAYDRGRIIGEYVSPAFIVKFATRLARFDDVVDVARAAVETRFDLHIDCVGGPSSFVAGTLVWTPDGPTSIENIVTNQLVFSRNEYNFIDQYQAVGGITNRTTDHYYKIYTEQDLLEVTAEHPMWVQGKGWTNAEDIIRGNIIATATGDTIVLTNTKVDRTSLVYNFSVQNTPNYFVGNSGIWVHNVNVSIPCRIPWPQSVSLLGRNLDLLAIQRNQLFGTNSGNGQGDLRSNLIEQYPVLDNLNGTNGNAWQAHHIVPFSFEHDLLRTLDFDVNSIHNGIPLPSDRANTLSAVHNGRHVRAYEDALRDYLDAIEDLDLTNDAKRDAIIDGIENMRQHLANADVQLNVDRDLTTLEVFTEVYRPALELAGDRVVRSTQ